jgi:trk system potassium uptake protein TrkH
MQLYPSSLLHGEQDPLLDRLKDTGVVVVSIYAILAIVCCILLMFSGLTPFDSITHALTAVSTGGFSTHNNSIASFNNVYAEIILILFMILGATNISLLWLVLRRQEFVVIKKDPELTKFIVAIIIISTIIGISLITLSDIDKLSAFRVGVFSTVSAITTTGFYSGQNTGWPLFVPMLLLVLMFAGGCTGSATGGLKTMRVMLLFRLAQREISRLAHPHGVEGIRYSGLSVDNEAMRAIWAFFVVLTLAFGFITISLALTGMDFRDSVFSAAGALSNTVPATVYLQDSFASFEGAAVGTKIILCIGMIIGRLEFLTALIIFNPLFWRQ